MSLTVPQRTVADTGSFPVDPTGVAEWLNTLQGLSSGNDAREVYRGLKHSNRLHNDVDRRRAVLACFIPVLRELHQHLSELTNAQPLPLTREFMRNAKLRDSLLREEVFAFKLLLNDSEAPAAADARRAMRALARQAESMIHGYRELPRGILLDAHQLYQLAEEHDLVEEVAKVDSASMTGYDLHGKPESSIPETLADHYRYILLLYLADLRQQRVRQLPLLLTFLRECSRKISIEKLSADTSDPLRYAVDLAHATSPEPAPSLLPGDMHSRRYFSLTPAIAHIETQLKSLQTGPGGLLGADTLERQSLLRLHLALNRSRRRRAARTICHDATRISFGHKEIANALMLSKTPEEDTDSRDNTSEWIIMNRSTQGCLITHPDCRAGLVQVGDIVSIGETTIGTVRWVHARGDNALDAGIEYIARKVLPVNITRLDAENDVAEKAMIIACKVEKQVMQTILLPAYLYQVGDRLLAAQDDKRRQFLLKRCLQANGLFSHFTLADV